MSFDRIVLVKKATDLEGLLKRFSTPSQVQFHLQSRGQDYESYKRSHELYHAALEKTQNEMPRTVTTVNIDRDRLETYQFGKNDVIVAIGDAGLVVNIAKYANEQPIVSVNPDPKRYDMVLSTCTADSVQEIIKKTLDEKLPIQKLTMAEVTLDDGQIMYAVNDLFIGKKSHPSAKYHIAQNNYTEWHSSSGIIICTGTGSTGWMTSYVKTAEALTGSKHKLPTEIPYAPELPYLIFAVRESFPTPNSGTKLLYGKITKDKPLTITSCMAEDGVIFSDGIESDFLNFNAGYTATIKPSDKKVHLVRENVEEKYRK